LTYITKEGAVELERQREQFHEAILSTAKLLAIKDGRGAIDEVHIRKAAKRVTPYQNNTMKWILAISSAVLLGLALFQISTIYASSQFYLWLLPIFSIAWVTIIAYVLKDFV
jgi:hypothetical protein